MAAVKNRGYSLNYSSYELRNDFNIVKIAVSNDGKSLSFASKTIQDNNEIVLLAINNCYEAF